MKRLFPSLPAHRRRCGRTVIPAQSHLYRRDKPLGVKIKAVPETVTPLPLWEGPGEGSKRRNLLFRPLPQPLPQGEGSFLVQPDCLILPQMRTNPAMTCAAGHYTGNGAAFSRSILNRLLTLRSFTWPIRRR